MGSLFHASKPLGLFSYFLPLKKPDQTEKCYHKWAGTVQYFISSLEKVEKRLHILVDYELFPTLRHFLGRINVANTDYMRCIIKY